MHRLNLLLADRFAGAVAAAAAAHSSSDGGGGIAATPTALLRPVPVLVRLLQLCLCRSPICSCSLCAVQFSLRQKGVSSCGPRLGSILMNLPLFLSRPTPLSKGPHHASQPTCASAMARASSRVMGSSMAAATASASEADTASATASSSSSFRSRSCRRRSCSPDWVRLGQAVQCA